MKKAESTISTEGHIEVIEQEVETEQISSLVTSLSVKCLSSYSTKAALKAGQGTRLTKV